MVDDGGDDIGVGEPTSLDDVRQDVLDVVVVGFGPAQFRNQRTEGIGFNHGLRLVGGQAAALDEAHPAVVLGSGDDGFVFGGELSDRTQLLLLDGDGLVRGQLRTHMLKHPKQHRPAGGVGGAARMRLGSFVGPVEDHVGAVSVLAAGHRDIEVIPRARRLDQDVRRVDDDALRPVCCACVAEVDVLSQVVGRQDDTVAEPGPRWSDRDRPVGQGDVGARA